jgi:hypothetical protein
MSGMLSDDEIAELIPSELVQTNTPIPTRLVSSDEFYPDPQNEKQREVEHCLLAMPTTSAASKASTGAASSRPLPAWRPRSSR